MRIPWCVCHHRQLGTRTWQTTSVWGLPAKIRGHVYAWVCGGSSVAGIGKQGCVFVWQCNSNQIASWDSVSHLEPLKALQTVYFEHNPIWADSTNPNQINPNYRRKVTLILPWVKQIDATYCRWRLVWWNLYSKWAFSTHRSSFRLLSTWNW